MSMPGMNKNLITKYLELSAATAKGYVVRVQNILHQEAEDMIQVKQMCSAI